jgi:hypothetical protein
MTSPSGDSRTVRLAVRAATWSAVIGAVGVAFLVAMFAAFAAGATPAGMTLGWINDVLVLVSYLLAAPVVLVLHLLLRRDRAVASTALAVIGIAAIAAIVVLQWLLVIGAMPFEEEVGPVSIALLVFGAWLVLIGLLGRSSGVLPDGVRAGALGATYFGYPIWAIRIARRLGALAPSSAESPRMAGGSVAPREEGSSAS